MSETPPPPTRSDVVVIGGGVVGVFAALSLAERGVSVALCEKGRIAAEQSSRNWGWIRTQGRNPAELPLMLEASSLWERTAAALEEDIGFGRRGIAYVFETEAEEARRAEWLERARPVGLDSRMLSAAETDALLGRQDRAFRGALHTRVAPSRRSRAGLRRWARRCWRAAPPARWTSRADAFAALSPSAAASPATRSCWREAHGRASSLKIMEKRCRSLP